MTSAINDSTGSHKKSKHRKETEEIPEKGGKGKDKPEGDDAVNDPEKETHKKEKKKKKHNGDTQKDGAALAGEDAIVSKREKRKRKRDIEINDEEAQDAKTSPKKKQKKTHRSDDDKSIKLKKKKSNSAGGDNEESPKPLKKSKKSRKNKTGFFDPDQDEETDLPEQARKALSYAFCRFYDPDRWKFNKARQNWLVRNLWNFPSLPEKYEDLVVKYLSAVQGNTRENILKICHKTLDQSTANGISDTSMSTSGPIITTQTPSDNGDQRKARARALLKALTPDPAS